MGPDLVPGVIAHPWNISERSDATQINIFLSDLVQAEVAIVACLLEVRVRIQLLVTFLREGLGNIRMSNATSQGLVSNARLVLADLLQSTYLTVVLLSVRMRLVCAAWHCSWPVLVALVVLVDPWVLLDDASNSE